jgi:hypothetical protein
LDLALFQKSENPIYDFEAAIMAAMFSQNPLMNGPNYSFSDTPKKNSGEPREHRFNPYAELQRSLRCSD